MRIYVKSDTLQILTFSTLFTASALLMNPNARGQTELSNAVDVQEIVDRAIVRAEAQENDISGFECLMQSVVESLDGEGIVEKEEKAVYRRYPLLGAVYDEMIEKDGRPLTGQELAKEKKQKDKFIDEIQKRIERGEPLQPEDERRVRLDQEFISRYRLELIGTEVVRGHRCWIVYIEPKDGKLPVRRRIDHALNNSTGRLWISQDDYGLARVEFAMREPFRYWGGLIATIRNTTGRLNFEPAESDLWMPVDFALELDMRIFFKNIRRRITTTWSDYRRVDSSVLSTSTSSHPQ